MQTRRMGIQTWNDFLMSYSLLPTLDLANSAETTQFQSRCSAVNLSGACRGQLADPQSGSKTDVEFTSFTRAGKPVQSKGWRDWQVAEETPEDDAGDGFYNSREPTNL